ncbi:unnamed protein product [Lactuca virosa]|uniref:Uncharacterized protein n=1 Tax=Lactuca virosa TaxID=75947 RepID=A0AAU9NHT3_9ASTR|nr:unnamed protein product [Lactuca virosa]
MVPVVSQILSFLPEKKLITEAKSLNRHSSDLTLTQTQQFHVHQTTTPSHCSFYTLRLLSTVSQACCPGEATTDDGRFTVFTKSTRKSFPKFQSQFPSLTPLLTPAASIAEIQHRFLSSMSPLFTPTTIISLRFSKILFGLFSISAL